MATWSPRELDNLAFVKSLPPDDQRQALASLLREIPGVQRRLAAAEAEQITTSDAANSGPRRAEIKELERQAADPNLSPDQRNAAAQKAAELTATRDALRQEQNRVDQIVFQTTDYLAVLESGLRNLELSVAQLPPETPPAPPQSSVDSAGAIQTEAETARDDGAASQLPSAGQQVIDQEGRIGPEAATNVTTNAEKFEPNADANTEAGAASDAKTTEVTQATPPQTTDPGGAGTSATPSTPTSATNPIQSPGVAEGREDSSSPTAANEVVAASNARYSGVIRPQPNELDRYGSYTYSISIYMFGPDEVAAFYIDQQRKLNSKNLIIQSGGIANNERNPFFPLDFYIDDLTIQSFQQGAGTGISHNATEMSFTLTEPYGITLFRRMTAAIADLNQRTGNTNTHYASQPYLMAIRFYGYDADGKLVAPGTSNSAAIDNGAGANQDTSDSNAIVEKFIPFIFTSIKLKMTNAYTQYQCECQALQDLGFSQSRGIIPYNVQLTATTLENLLVGNYKATQAPTRNNANESAAEAARLARQKAAATPAKASSAPTPTVTAGLVEALNRYQAERVKAGEYEYADEYNIVFTDNSSALRNAKVIPPGQTDLATTGQTKPQTAADARDPAKNSVQSSSLNVNITAGTPLAKFLDQVIRGSEYIYNQQIKIKDPKTGKTVIKDTGATTSPSWYRIGVQMVPISNKFDRKRGDYAYQITYSINMYSVAKIESPWFPKGQFKGVHKKYEYWFTGQNTSIINFEQDFNYQYYLTVNAEQQAQNITSDYRELYRKSYSPNSGQSAQGAGGNAREPGANAADYLYDPASQGEVTIEIIGDPAWIYQGEMWSGVGGEAITNPDYVNFLPDGTINHESQEVLFELAWNQPADYNLDTGLMDIRRVQ